MTTPRRNAAFSRCRRGRRSTFAMPVIRAPALCSVAPDSYRRSELAREQVAATRSSLYDAALPSSRTSGFALLGESLFPNAEKVTKNACPYIRVSLRSTSLSPSALRGPAYKGHPWPFTPLAASMPLAPLRADSIRPPERGTRRRLIACSSANKQSSAGRKTAKHFPPQSTLQSVSNYADENRWASFALPTLRSERGAGRRLAACSSANKRGAVVSLFTIFQAARTRFPFRRPSVGAAQGDARHGCRARRDRPGMALRAGLRSSTGAREVLRSKTRMLGWPSFWLLFLGHTRKSDSPSRAKPMLQPTPQIGHTPRAPKHIALQPSPLLKNPHRNDTFKLPNPVAARCDTYEENPLVCA